MSSALEEGAQPSALVASSTLVSPRVTTALILRMRALVAHWIAVEVDEESITANEGLINEDAVAAFIQAGGDVTNAVPFALLEARKTFLNDASHREHSLNEQRALACEVIARRVVAELERAEDKLSAQSNEGRGQKGSSGISSHISLSKRFVRIEDDGDRTLPTSALETAVDQNCVHFLSSPEAQKCANELWKGYITQQYSDNGLVFFEPHHPASSSFIDRLDPSRLAVPQYQYYTGILIHVALIVVYTFSTLEYTGLDTWEILLWCFAAGYLVDDITRWIKMRGFDSVISFWVIVDFFTDALFVTAFAFRVAGWVARSQERSDELQLLAFQFLSCVAPFLWMLLLKALDGSQYIGIIQLVLLRMLQETAAFFILLLLTAVGFAQSLFALDAADGRRVPNSVSFVVNLLTAAILGQPDFDGPADNFGEPFGTILFYVFSFITLMLLSNILVAFFASAYDKTVDNAEDVFRAYFCSKVISTIRAPDQYVYLAPFNLIEAFLIAPLEPLLPRKTYAGINRVVQSVLFCVPLVFIALYETYMESQVAKALRLEMLESMPEERQRRRIQVTGIENGVLDPEIPSRDGQSADEGEEDLVISRVKFETLSKRLPVVKGQEEEEKDDKVTADDLRTVLSELKSLRQELAELKSAK
ncbi:hypothetical protein FA10DRAFT_227803 [Acaromyces ingoldii]|uniref:Ion transport domain-containing protein n=1 Tax=Acaromyces ingoldii TaxID=215250 RepID=A0A316YRH1_9BASI|nr:hypothetical protein FA10DRAFT_227803 [Acaromyces ingoldii]PWN91977.1 hypothetical protein FA10DRAFT_227803 [Acaromyces ingoldii]